jgi:outer membrane receptor for ferrienterochelin and colicins
MFGFAGSPKLSGMMHLGKGWRILGGVGVGYRAPDFSDLAFRTMQYNQKPQSPASPPSACPGWEAG